MRRITPATVTVGVLVAFVGLVGAYVVKDAMKPRQTPIAVVNNVMVAIADFPTDYVLRSEDIGRMNMPRSQVPQGAMMERASLVGRRLKTPAKALSPFVGNMLYPPGGGPTLSSKLKPGFRAVTIETSPASAGLGGLAKPGDIVDILMTINPANPQDTNNLAITRLKQKGGTTITLLRGIEVLAVNQNIDREVPTRNQNQMPNISVTVALSPDDANTIVLAKAYGQLQLALRNPKEEPSNATPKPATLEDMLGLKPFEDVTPPEPKRFFAEVFRKTSREELEFDMSKKPQRLIPGANSVGSAPARVRNNARQQTTPQAQQQPPSQPANAPARPNSSGTSAPQPPAPISGNSS